MTTIYATRYLVIKRKITKEIDVQNIINNFANIKARKKHLLK